jgi:ADP-ribosylglycohydrolase
MFASAMASSLMTHRDIRSLAGAMAVANAIRRLLEGAARDPSFLFRLAADVARDEDRIAATFGGLVTSVDAHPRSLSRSIAHAESLLELPRERALTALAEEANRHGADPICKRATMGFPPACIPTCLYLMLTTDSFEEAIVEVINLGGDADTTGAILGALLGAHYGIKAIPARWLDQLQNREAIDNRAFALHRKSTEGLKIPDLIAREHELSALEGARRERLLAHSQNGGDLGANRRL